MQIYIANISGSDVTIQGQLIASMNAFAIPAVDLKAWLGDFSLRMRILTNVCQPQDSNGNAINSDDFQDLARAILADEVGTS